MQKNFDKLKSDIQKALDKLNIQVTNIEYREEGTYKFLTIELDRVNGLDLDSIVEATHIINPIVDKYDITSESYILDVISREKGDK